METHNRSVLARSIVLVLAGLNVTLLLVAILASRALPDPPTSDDYLTASAWILAAMIPISVGGGILQPAINSLITRRVALAEVGGMLGISAAFLSAANAIAPLAGGALFQSISPAAPFIIWGLFMALLLLLAIHYIKPGREESEPAGLARGGAH